MQEKHQLIPLSWRQGGKKRDKNNISKKWGLYGTTLAELVWGVPCSLLGMQVSGEETSVSEVRHIDLVRQSSRQTLKLRTGKRSASYLGFEMTK